MTRHYHYLLNGQLIRIRARRRPSAKTIPKCGKWKVDVFIMTTAHGLKAFNVEDEMTWPELLASKYLGSAEVGE